MDGFPETRGKILSKLKQNPQKLNLPEIPVTSIAAKTTKKADIIAKFDTGLS